MNPHDTLLRWTFSQREHAAGLLKAAFPPDLTRAFDWGTLRLEKGRFVTVRSRLLDLVFSIVAAGQPLFVYVLVDRRLKPDVHMGVRALIYASKLWLQNLRAKPAGKKLPQVVAIALHNSATGWTAVTTCKGLTAAGRAERTPLAQPVPRSKTRRSGVSPDRASPLVDTALTALGQLVMACLSVAGDARRLERELVRMGSALGRVLASADRLAALEALVRYLVARYPYLSAGNVGELFEKAVGPQGQEAIVTFLDEIEARGQAKGKLEGKREALLDLLAARFGRVPARLQDRIRAAEEAAVGRWTVRVLTAKTAAEVIGDDTDATGGARAVSTKRTGGANRRAAVASKRA